MAWRGIKNIMLFKQAWVFNEHGIKWVFNEHGIKQVFNAQKFVLFILYLGYWLNWLNISLCSFSVGLVFNDLLWNAIVISSWKYPSFEAKINMLNYSPSCFDVLLYPGLDSLLYIFL